MGQSRDQWGHDVMEGNGGSRDEGSCDGAGSRDWESNVTEHNGGSRDWVTGGHVICGSHVIGGGHVMEVDVMEVNGGSHDGVT